MKVLPAQQKAIEARDQLINFATKKQWTKVLSAARKYAKAMDELEEAQADAAVREALGIENKIG